MPITETRPLGPPIVGAARSSTTRGWAITAMLALFMIVNWGDKSVLGLTGKALMQDLGLTPSQYGFIGSAFFFLFGIGTVLGGFLVDRIKTTPMLLAMGVVWALVQFPVLGFASFGVLLAARIVLGFAEGPASPVALHAVMKWFPDDRRDVPAAIVMGASSLGLLVAAPVMAFVQVHWGWRWCFGVLGIAGLVWSLLWLLIGREGPYDKGAASGPQADPESSARADAGRVPFLRILRSRTWLAFAVSGFGCYVVTALLTTWVPTYLGTVAGLDTLSMGNWMAATAAVGAVAMFSQGAISRLLISRGVSKRRARAGVASVYILIAAACLVGFVFTTGTTQLLLMLPAFNLFVATFPAGSAAIAQIAPVAQRGAALGVLFGALGLAGVLAPYITGRLIQAAAIPADGYHVAFLIGAGLLVVAGLTVLFLADPDRDAERLAALKK